jgi:hypothetical protein
MGRFSKLSTFFEEKNRPHFSQICAKFSENFENLTTILTDQYFPATHPYQNQS